ncbi:uncharacterized protein LOC143246316 isoform X3 [Tachypleus tridentatus]
MDPPDVTIVFCNDVEEWGDYLSDCLHHVLDPFLNVYQMRVECLFFPLPESCVLNVSKAQVVLIIMSQRFLDFLEDMPRASQLTSLLKPSQTVAVLCGLKDHDINFHHKKSLVTFDLWTRLKVPKPEEKYVRNIIKTVSLILEEGRNQGERMQKLCFELWPKVIHERSREVFVVLNTPVQEDHDFRVILIINDKQQEVKANRRNPFTFLFYVPATFASTSSMISVHIWCNTCYYGKETLYYRSAMAQLYELLHNIVSPYEFLRQSLNKTTNLEADQQLTQIFKNNLPSSGFSLLTPTSGPFLRSEDELPTLLHFSACYGMKELTSALLNSPGSERACYLGNRQGLLPVHIAQREGHNEIAEMLDSFQKREERELCQIASFVPKMIKYEENDMNSSFQNCPTYENKFDFCSFPDTSRDSYEKMNKYKDYMLMQRLPVLHQSESILKHPTHQDQPRSIPLSSQNSFTELGKFGEYLSMSTCRVLQQSVDLQPHQKLLFESFGNENEGERKAVTCENSIFYTQCSTDDVSQGKLEEQETDSSQYSECCINTSQQELISIMEVYENVTTMTESEMKVKKWNKRNDMSSTKISNSSDKLMPQVIKIVKPEDFVNTTNEYSNVSETTSAEITSKDSESSNLYSTVCSENGSGGCCCPDTNEGNKVLNAKSQKSDGCGSVFIKNYRNSVFYCELESERNKLKVVNSGLANGGVRSRADMPLPKEQPQQSENSANSTVIITSRRESFDPGYENVFFRAENPGFEKDQCSIKPTNVVTSSRILTNHAATDEKQFPNPNYHQCESKSVQVLLDDLLINQKGSISVRDENENLTAKSSSNSNRINTKNSRCRKAKSQVRPSVKKQTCLSSNSKPHGSSESGHNHCSSSQNENIYEEVVTQIFPVVSNGTLHQHHSSQAENVYIEPTTLVSSKYFSNNALHKHYSLQTKNIHNQPITLDPSGYSSNTLSRNYSMDHINYFPELRIPNTFDFQNSSAKMRKENYKNFLSLPDLLGSREGNVALSHSPSAQFQSLLNVESTARGKSNSFSGCLAEATTLCKKHIPLKNVKGSECYI